MNDIPIRAATTTELSRSIVECGWSARVPNTAYIAMCDRVMATGAMMRSCGSGALGLAEVAAGRIDAYVERHINLWDVAAALVVLTEAGAVTSDFLGGTGLEVGNPILAAAPGIAEALGIAAALPA